MEHLTSWVRKSSYADSMKDKLDSSIGGIKDMNGLPDILFVVDVDHERIAINEQISWAFRWLVLLIPTQIRWS